MKNILTNTRQCLSQEEIRRYLSNELSDDQRYELENHLLDCPLCNAAVEGLAMQYDFEKDTQLQEIEAAISAREEMTTEVVSLPPRNRWLINRIAAGLLFLVLATAALLYWQSEQEQRLYQAYYEAPDTDLFASLRSGSGDGGTTASLDQAVQLYQQQAFTQSLPYFEAYLAAHPENPTANFLAGMAYLETGQLALAQQQLSIARINSEVFYEQASWYLALAHLKAEDLDQTIALLKELSQSNQTAYREKAISLLMDLGEAE